MALANVRRYSYNLLHNFENPLDRERVSRTVLRRYVISRVSVNVGASHPRESCESPRRNLVTYLAVGRRKYNSNRPDPAKFSRRLGYNRLGNGRRENEAIETFTWKA